MTDFSHLGGVYAAAVTPLHSSFVLDLEALPDLLHFLAQRGCHGVLLLGTTGEGPSFSPEERLAIFRSARRIREVVPDFRLLAGTGTPSLEETRQLTKAAFDLGLDGVVVLPPYYYRKVSDDGLFAWFQAILQSAVPAGGALLGYHIPDVSGVPLSLDLLSRLKDAFPNRFAGLKDSSGDLGQAKELGQRFGKSLLILTGSDKLFSLALQHQASGCITALANLASPLLRQVWDAHQAGQTNPSAQSQLEAMRAVMDRYPPAPPLIKAFLHQDHALPRWSVRPPLLPLPEKACSTAWQEMNNIVSLTPR